MVNVMTDRQTQNLASGRPAGPAQQESVVIVNTLASLAGWDWPEAPFAARALPAWLGLGLGLGLVQTQCWCPKDRDSRYDDSVVLIIIDSVQFRVGGRG
jgi:hypothetical protein